MKRLGVRKLYFILKPQLDQHQITIGRDGLFDLLSRHQMLIRKKKRRVITTQSYHGYHKYKNLIKDFTPLNPNELWVSDITYVEFKDVFYYLFLITDAYSRKIVGHVLARSLHAIHAVNALKIALKQREFRPGDLIHHSDQGFQYCCKAYIDLLRVNKVKISMTQNGDPLENAIAERVNGILKQEWINGFRGNSFEELEAFVEESIEVYNSERPHASIDMLTPEQAHQLSGPIKRRWKTYYKNKNKTPESVI